MTHHYLIKSSEFNHQDFYLYENSQEAMDDLSNCRVLCVGAGGLGCEIIKNLALIGFRSIDIIDNDTISLTNLNRQFLFRENDIGKFKAEVAAQFIKQRVKNMKVNCFTETIQQRYQENKNFYWKYSIIIAGLDNIQARLWLSELIVKYYKDQYNNESFNKIILLDGGSSSDQGVARHIIPFTTACYNCINLIHPQQNIETASCTLATRPRNPAHCVEYIKYLEEKGKNNYLEHFKKMFGQEFQLDIENPEHQQYIFLSSKLRAQQHGITQKFSLFDVIGWYKRPIPALGTSNSIIAGILANEAFKALTMCRPVNYEVKMFTSEGMSFSNFQIDKLDECNVCGNQQINQ